MSPIDGKCLIPRCLFLIKKFKFSFKNAVSGRGLKSFHKFMAV